eukprot:1160686-Pelagomonas_calceolata.AAC.7
MHSALVQIALGMHSTGTQKKRALLNLAYTFRDFCVSNAPQLPMDHGELLMSQLLPSLPFTPAQASLITSVCRTPLRLAAPTKPMVGGSAFLAQLHSHAHVHAHTCAHLRSTCQACRGWRLFLGPVAEGLLKQQAHRCPACSTGQYIHSRGKSGSHMSSLQHRPMCSLSHLQELSHRVHAFMLHSCGRNGMLLLNGYSSLQRVSLTTVVGMLTVKEGLPGLCQKESSLPRLPHL